MQAIEGRQLLHEGLDRVGLQAVLARFGRGVDLHEYIQRAVFQLQALLQGLGYAQAVQRTELAGKARHVARLVGLQMADHRPVHAQVGHRFSLALCLLHLVLAQFVAACGYRHADAGVIDGLADRQQAHTGRVPADAGAGIGDALAHRDQVGGDLFNGLGDGPVGSGKGHAGTSTQGGQGGIHWHRTRDILA